MTALALAEEARSISAADHSATMRVVRLELGSRPRGPIPNSASIADLEPTQGWDHARAQAACNNWRPNSGSISTKPSSVANNRYVHQSFIWRDGSRLNNLLACSSGTEAYEAEAWYSANNGFYLDSTTNSWTSSMPAAYLDTELFNGTSNLGRTIGISNAAGLAEDVTYTTYIRTPNGTAASDFGSAKGQAGRNWCAGVTSTWCVFALDTEDLLPAWIHLIPGQNSWVH